MIGISLRFSFGYDKDSIIEGGKEKSNETVVFKKIAYWSIADYVSDLVYLLDIIFVNTRIRFIDDGLWVTDKKLIIKKYLRSTNFYVIFKKAYKKTKALFLYLNLLAGRFVTDTN